jgi:nucleoside-diphosphate-sugar epimerase
MKHKVLLTGASGAIGYQVLRELLSRGDTYQIRLLCLDRFYEKKLLRPYRGRVEIVWGDIRNYEEVCLAVEGVNSVLHIAGIIPPAADLKPVLARSVNVNGTANLINAIKQQINPPKLIFTSSIAVYGDRLNNPYIEVGDPLEPSEGDFYAQTKIDAEKIIKFSGLDWVIFRLCGVLVDDLNIQPMMFHMPLNTPLEWCHVADVGYALVESTKYPVVLGRIFNLGGGPQCRTIARDFLANMLPKWGIDFKEIPEFAFATRNFHSGYYKDTELLNQVLQFQRSSILDYYRFVEERVSSFRRFIIRCIPRALVYKWFTRMSEPLRAIKENDEPLIERFYGSREAFERLLIQNTGSIKF